MDRESRQHRERKEMMSKERRMEAVMRMKIKQRKHRDRHTVERERSIYRNNNKNRRARREWIERRDLRFEMGSWGERWTVNVEGGGGG